MKILFSCCLFFFLCSSLHAQNSAIFEKRVYRAASDSLHYRLLYPAHYDQTKHYPLLVFLHGAGERGDDNELQLALIPAALIDSAGRAKYPCFILAPQCPAKSVWVDFPDFPKSLKATAEPTLPAKLSLSLITKLLQQLPVDAKRIYITGYSMGGEGTFDFLSRRPDLFAAAVPICSVADTSKAALIAHTPVWAFHGDKDDINNVRYTRMMIAAIRKNGGAPKYTEYAGRDHYIVKTVYQEKELFNWLFHQKLRL